MLLDLVIQIHDMENIQQLALILVETLYLYVKDRSRVHGDSVMLLDIFCQAYLVLVLDIHEFLLSLLIVRVDFQFGNLRQICDPLISDMGCHPVSQQRISMKQETALCNSVGLVVKFFRHHLIEILQLLMLENLGMQSCHAVYGIACSDSQMSHLYLAVIDNRHLADFFLIARVFLLDLDHKAAVDLFDDLIYTGKQAGEQLDRPFFQSLGHDGMVCVSAGLCGDLPCLIPFQAFLVDQDTHQLCHCHRRVGIVQLEGGLLIELADVAVRSLIAVDGSLHAGGNEEILLL